MWWGTSDGDNGDNDDVGFGDNSDDDDNDDDKYGYTTNDFSHPAVTEVAPNLKKDCRCPQLFFSTNPTWLFCPLIRYRRA